MQQCINDRKDLIKEV